MTKDVFLEMVFNNKPYDYTVISTEQVDNTLTVYIDVKEELSKAMKAFKGGKLSEHLDDYLCGDFRQAFYRMREEKLVPADFMRTFDISPKDMFSNHSSSGWSILVMQAKI